MKHIDPGDYPDWVYLGLKERASSPEELEDLLYQWDERCGIRYFEGGQPLKDAETQAYQDILNRLKKKQ